MLFLFAGEDHQLFTLHTELLPAATKSYLCERFAAQQFCWLREHDAGTVQLYRLFLYTSKIHSINEEMDQDTVDDGQAESHEDAEWTKLAHAYLLGRTIRDEAFANACVTAIIEKVKATERFPTGIASEVYANTLSRDSLRRLLVDLHVWTGEGKCVLPPHEDADGPRTFLRDVRLELRKTRRLREEQEAPWEVDRCAYHVHEETKKCEQ